jgi:hypothetical protein
METAPDEWSGLSTCGLGRVTVPRCRPWHMGFWPAAGWAEQTTGGLFWARIQNWTRTGGLAITRTHYRTVPVMTEQFFWPALTLLEGTC